MNNELIYDVAIVGGGLAGLSLAILLREQGYSVLVAEKENYPRHKVCGEYISMESLPFLKRLGLPVSTMGLPVINKLTITDVKGSELQATLPQGGFGISRHKLDQMLAEKARQAGAILLTDTKTDDITHMNGYMHMQAANKIYKAKVACGAWGKRSNIDVKWHRPFVQEKKRRLNNYIGIKYHINYPWQPDEIALHNFSGGYCGISRVEDGKCCLCYLTTAANLKKSGNSIKRMERDILMRNPHLATIFSEADFLYTQPLAISQISFQKKEQVHDHVLLTGDAAGMIPPLCGNGMSMALHSAKLALNAIHPFLQEKISRKRMEEQYKTAWEAAFSRRLAAGRFLQANFGKNILTTLFINTLRHMPALQKKLIASASGKTF